MQLKQRALVPILLTMVAGSIYAVHNLVSTGGALAWHGALLASASLPIYMVIFLAKGGAARTSSVLTPVQAATALGVVLAGSEGAALLLALLSFAGLQWYVFVYSRYGRKKSGAIIVGQQLPALAFEDMDGARITTEDFIGSQTLLVFFRGNWCPLCMAQLRELRDRADRLAAAHVQIRFISNQSLEKSRELAAKLDLPSHFQVLRDRGLASATQLHIADMGGAPAGLSGYPRDTAMATVIALDARGRVLFGDETDNYRVRPHPDAFLHVFEGSPGGTPVRHHASRRSAEVLGT
ncbi:MAG: peroxiredoxin family protein [Hyphomonas sp.]|nr:peroxiredoxin family protein [Hyphomonas sp.]